MVVHFSWTFYLELNTVDQAHLPRMQDYFSVDFMHMASVSLHLSKKYLWILNFTVSAIPIIFNQWHGREFKKGKDMCIPMADSC